MALLYRMNSPQNMKFPQYRRYKNGLSYFKILSIAEFEEIKVIGKKRSMQHVVANQYPEKVFINDLLFKYEEFAVVIMEEDFLAVMR
jgi:hypothetical protein